MDKKDSFLKLFVKNSKKLFGFILVMVPNHVDAEDILQETAIVLWNKFDEFTPGTSFYMWARQIARNKAYEYYKQKKRFVDIDLSFIEEIQTINESLLHEQEERMAALRGCLTKLSPKDLNLVNVRFRKDITLKEVAEEANLSIHTVYKRMACIYVLLQSCIRKTLISWGT